MTSPEPKKWIARTQSAVAEFFGVSPETVTSWRAKKMPGREGYYDLAEILAWLRTVGPWREKNSRMRFDDDDEILTDRQREQKSKADLLEMRVLEKAGELVQAADVRVGLDRLADAIRGLGENFGRSPVPISGHDAQRRLNEMIENLEWNVT